MFGVCSRWNRMKGWGFVIADDPSKPDFFVSYRHIQAIASRRYLLPGDRVEFEPKGENTDRPYAVNVRKLAPAPVAGGAQ